jgi:hypothetical protein
LIICPLKYFERKKDRSSLYPMPDASKLVKERGMFRYAANTQGTKGKGFIFWIDELRFEKLGSLAHPRPFISIGEDKEDIKFTYSDGSTETWNIIELREKEMKLKLNDGTDIIEATFEKK